jgi:hypothetical protein
VCGLRRISVCVKPGVGGTFTAGLGVPKLCFRESVEVEKNWEHGSIITLPGVGFHFRMAWVVYEMQQWWKCLHTLRQRDGSGCKPFPWTKRMRTQQHAEAAASVLIGKLHDCGEYQAVTIKNPLFFLWRYSPNLGLGLLPWNFRFSRFRTDGRAPWVGDKLFARSLPVHKHRKTHIHKNIHALSGIRTPDPGFRALDKTKSRNDVLTAASTEEDMA